MKKTVVLFLSFAMLFAFSGCFITNPDKTTTTEKKEKVVIQVPNTQEECIAKGGTWKPVGIFPNPICNIPTTDGGKECSSSNDCEGSCLAVDLTEDQKSSLMRGKEGLGMKVNGECSKWVKNFGCIGFVEEGKVDKFLCLD